METINLEALDERDRETKPPGAREDWLIQSAMYEDSGLDWTKEVLSRLQVGLPKNTTPVQVAMLRRIVDRLAVIYDRPPTRWLLAANGKRLSEESAEHKLMEKLLGRPYNLAWRTIDRKRALHRNVVVRFYPSDVRKQVVLRTFEPFAVMRDVGSEPDMMDADNRFALNVGTIAEPRWEFWERLEGDSWRCLVLDERGAVIDRPFAAWDDVCPYVRLPVQIVFDEWPDGRAWLSPRSSRTTWVAAINSLANDLWSMVVHQAHTQEWAEAEDARDVPDESGHGVRPVFTNGAKLHTLDTNPKIVESLKTLQGFLRFWVGGEDLPTDEFQEGRQVVTGAALKVQEAPLMARREALVEQAPEDEAQAWARYRAVYAVHRERWGAPAAPDRDLEVEISDVNPPTDPAKLQESSARSMALGTGSRIDAIMEAKGCNRRRAIQIAEQVDEDNKRFPPPGNPLEVVSGPKPASTDHQSPSPTGSTVQAIQAAKETDATEPQGLPAA